MRLNAFRNPLLQLFGAFAAAVVLASCGGGGGTSSGSSAATGGVLQLGPDNGTAYAGMPYTLTITGGRPPYTLSSNDQGIFPVPNQTTSNFVTVIPGNPGVIDSTVQPGELPVRTVNLTVRDASTQAANNTVKVAQNFLTGYGISLTRTTCPANTSTASTTITTACAGGETALSIQATTNGTLHGNQQFRLIVQRGNFSLRTPDGQSGGSVTTTSDHSGTVTAIIQVPANATTQVAIVRVQDVATGVYTDETFVINGATGSSGNGGSLTAIPTDITFTGALSNECGTGTADFLVFDGTPPYTVNVTDPQDVVVTPASTPDNPGRFTIKALNKNICLDKSSIVVTDSTGRRVTVTLTTKAGSTAAPTPAAFDVQPTAVTVGCGQTATVSVVGGTGLYTANSTHPRIVAFTFGNSVGINRVVGDGATSYPLTGVVSVTDGTSIKTVNVNTTANCP